MVSETDFFTFFSHFEFIALYIEFLYNPYRAPRFFSFKFLYHFLLFLILLLFFNNDVIISVYQAAVLLEQERQEMAKMQQGSGSRPMPPVSAVRGTLEIQ